MSFLSIILGFFLLILGGEWLMKSSVALSLNLNISKMVIGMTVVSFATSAPELIVSIQAAMSGHSDIALGNVIGSNIANIALVLAIVILISPIKVEDSFYKSDWPMMIFSCFLFAFMISYDFILSFKDGAILFSILILFLFILIRRKTNDEIINSEELEYLSNFKIIVYLILGGFGLWMGSDLLVNGAVAIAESFGVSERVISITLISVGTSIPELSASLIAIYKKEKAISIGNLLGSNIFNIMAVLGITSMIQPIKVLEMSLINVDLIWMICISFIILPIVFIPPKMILGRVSGLCLFLLYCTFITQLFV
mgnify:CR=1 FL=1|tara:strand:+ start:128 stop:1060 length:933 start_codon:yes stop_codon:yes gene_type:complete